MTAPISEPAWLPGDPCASCDSNLTGIDLEQGAWCAGCGRSDNND